MSMCEEALYPVQEGLSRINARSTTMSWCPTSALSKLNLGSKQVPPSPGPYLSTLFPESRQACHSTTKR